MMKVKQELEAIAALERREHIYLLWLYVLTLALPVAMALAFWL